MAVTFISAVANITTSVTLGTHAAGDLLLAFASREGNATPPDLPAGWTNVVAGGDASVSSRIGYKIAASGSETSGTWTNAQALAVHVYRGQSGITPVGANSSFISAGTSVDYPALSLQVMDGTSWVVAFAGHAWGSTATFNAPSGMTNRSNSAVDGPHCVGGHDTNGGVASWAGGNGTMTGGGSDDYLARSVEIREKDPAPPIPDFSLFPKLKLRR